MVHLIFCMLLVISRQFIDVVFGLLQPVQQAQTMQESEKGNKKTVFQSLDSAVGPS